MRRYEKGAINVTSNRPVEDWGKIRGDNSADSDILDRFLHQAEIIRLDGKSNRSQDGREQLKPGTGPVENSPVSTEKKD